MSLLSGFLDTPATLLVVVVLAVWYAGLLRTRAEWEWVGMSYHKVIGKSEVWRGLSAQLSHLDVLHLMFNLWALYSLSSWETVVGASEYLRTSLILLVMSVVIVMAIYHILIYQIGLAHYEYSFSVGYSCVVFGLMTVVSQTQPSFVLPLPGGVSLPVSTAPFGSLLLTQLLVRRASFLGHLAGIIAGFMVSFGWFNWLTGYWLYSSLAWAAFGLLCNLRTTTSISIPFVDVGDRSACQVRSTAVIENGVLRRGRGGTAVLVGEQDDEEMDGGGWV